MIKLSIEEKIYNEVKSRCQKSTNVYGIGAWDHHIKVVYELAKKYASEYGASEEIVSIAALLHDIGIFLTDAPRIHCYGTAPYICHGYYGAELLRMEGLFKHARVCERHTGVGLTKELIMDSGWPLPFMDFIPQTLEEQLICFADKFYSKTRYLEKARTMQQVVDSMEKISQEAVRKVKEWALIFG